MKTDTALNQLILKAQELGRHKSGAEAVRVALRGYIQQLQQREIISLSGAIEYHSNHGRRRAKQRKSK
jgi:metal-responsive CopG/Arc/MetJ family transcriptional regulator